MGARGIEIPVSQPAQDFISGWNFSPDMRLFAYHGNKWPCFRPTNKFVLIYIDERNREIHPSVLGIFQLETYRDGVCAGFVPDDIAVNHSVSKVFAYKFAQAIIVSLYPGEAFDIFKRVRYFMRDGK